MDQPPLLLRSTYCLILALGILKFLPVYQREYDEGHQLLW